MTLLRLEQLQLAYGHHVLLDGADLVLERGERLALVGRNGTGKSTLLRLVAGENQADSGTIWRAPGLKIGVLDVSALPGYDFEMFRRLAAPRLHALAPLRCQLVDIPMKFHHPMWVQNAEIDLDYHVRRAHVPAGCEDQA